MDDNKIPLVLSSDCKGDLKKNALIIESLNLFLSFFFIVPQHVHASISRGLPQLSDEYDEPLVYQVEAAITAMKLPSTSAQHEVAAPLASSSSGLAPSTEAALPDVDTPAKLAEVAAEEEAREEDALLMYEKNGGLDPPGYVDLPTADVSLEAPKDSATSGTSTGTTFPPLLAEHPHRQKGGKKTANKPAVFLSHHLEHSSRSTR